MNVTDRVISLQTDSLSNFKTLHHFENYGEIRSVDDYIYFATWARQNKKDIFILGNGSNTLFAKKKIQSLVLKNNLPRDIKCISTESNLYEVSSGVMAIDILNYCYKNSLDSFYYLASVPATVGGALAMNAGEGKHVNKTIYDFVEYVTYIDNDNVVKKVKPADMTIEHRRTMFTGCQDKFIVSAVFKFPVRDLSGINPIKERLLWAKQHQDNVAPNCGSVFKVNNHRVMDLLRKIGLKVGKARYSSKSVNWIKNKAGSGPTSIVFLISITKILHAIVMKKCEVEVITVK